MHLIPAALLHYSLELSEQGRRVNLYYFKLKNIILIVLQLLIVYS